MGTIGPGLFNCGPEVPIGDAGVGTPQNDGLGAVHGFGIHAERTAKNICRALPRGHPAQFTVDIGCPDSVEESIEHDAHLNQALRSSKGELGDRLWTAPVDSGTHLVGDGINSLSPADGLVGATTLGTGSSKWGLKTVGMVDAVEEAVHLRAQRSLRYRVIGVPFELRGVTIDHGDLPRAGVGAVMVTCAEHRQFRHAAESTRPTIVPELDDPWSRQCAAHQSCIDTPRGICFP